MLIDYSKVEKIKFDENEIDHNFNLNLLKAFEKLYLKSLEKKIDFIVTGGLGSLIYYNKIYRTLSDIDILIHMKDFKIWLEIFKDGYDIIYIKDPIQTLINFKDLKSNCLVFLDNEHKVKIEIINATVFSGSAAKVLDFYEVELNSFKIKVKQPFYSYKNKVTMERDKDFKDWDFFNKFLINT